MNFQLFIFDSDGCLVEGSRALEGARELTSLLKQLGKQVVVFTNNSTSHPNRVMEIYKNLGLEIDAIINSGLLAAEYCVDQNISSVFLIGEQGLVDVFLDVNIEVRNSEPVDAVIVGMDRTLTYDKLATATRMIRTGSRFIATNSDPSFPTPRGLEPGAGSMIAALCSATDKEPEIVLGKPNSWGYDLILKKYNSKPSNAIMFGDRFETDILGARKLDIPAILIGTGVSASRDKESEIAKLKNEWYVANLTEIVNILQINK